MHADTYGTGLLIADAFRRGCREITVCMGGTATCDGGFGAYSALKNLYGEMKEAGTKISLLCDVDNPFCGDSGAAPVFAPQKGATKSQILVLEEKLRSLGDFYKEKFGVEVKNKPYAGAAGGLAGMLMAVFGAEPVKGIERVLELLGFDRNLEGASMVLTGEGKADMTTLRGKAAKGILDAAKVKGVPVVLIAGKVDNRQILLNAGFHDVVQATPAGQESNDSYFNYLKEATANYLSSGAL